jgi:hypothetical protein
MAEARAALVGAFPGSFINSRDEFIAHLRTNQYIYQALGNAVRHNMTMQFIGHDMDMGWLRAKGAAKCG